MNPHARFLTAAAVFLTSLPALVQPVAASGDFVFQKVIAVGDAAPGTEAGTSFAPFGGEYVPMIPTIDEQGMIGFASRLQGPAITSTNGTSIWTGAPGSLTLVARAGAPAPGAGAGVYLSFPFDFDLMAPILGGGKVAFHGTLAGAGISESNNEGIWSGAAGGLSVLGREGTQAPGLAGGVLFSSPLFMVEMDQAGHAMMSGSVSGPGITSTNDEGFWSNRSGSSAVILREGDPAPGMAGVVYGGAGQFIGTGYNFESPRFNDFGKVAIQANLTGSGIGTFDNEALWVEQGGVMTRLAREGDAAPGAGNGATYGGHGVTVDFSELSYNALGQTAFVSRVDRPGGPGGYTVTYALFSDHTGPLSLLAEPGIPAPGTSQNFGIIGGQVLNDGGRIAFRASLADAGQWPPLGIWWDQAGSAGQLAALIVPGDPLAEQPGTTILGTNWIFGYSADGLIVIGADLEDPSSPSRPSILYADPQGLVRLLIAAGDLFDVHGDGTVMREVSSFHFGGLNAAGQMAIRLNFTDGGFGIYRVSRTQSGVNEPGPYAIRLAAFPNPFRSHTSISFHVPSATRVEVGIYDAAGRQVTRLLNGLRDAGPVVTTWDGRNSGGLPVSAGVYWARVAVGDETEAMRMVHLGR